MPAVKVIGLTGPIAAGKDTVARLLRRRGANIINADELAHTLYASQSPLWQQLLSTFGSRILNRGGLINRRKLAEIVFSDYDKLQQLNAIIHPHLKTAIINLVENIRTDRPDSKLIVINAAVLEEIGLLDHVDSVWLVTAPQTTRLKRLLKKGLERKAALKRLRAQASQKKYLVMADVVIENNSSPKELANRVAKLFREVIG